MSSIMQSIRQNFEKVSQKPLPRLVRLFVDRIFRGARIERRRTRYEDGFGSFSPCPARRFLLGVSA
jgi:hypothetical protein